MTEIDKQLTMETDRNGRKYSLFPKIEPSRLPETLRSERLREDVEADLQRDPEVWRAFCMLEQEYREMFIGFCMGNRGLNILYDPFFKKLMTDERLEQLLSQLMGQRVVIVNIEHTETRKRNAEASVMIMDLIVKLADGSYVDLEIQRITFDFPFERAVCYSSDIMVNQYDQLKLEQKQRHKEWVNWKKRQEALKAQGVEVEEIDPEPTVKFDYRSLRPVYVIVLMNSAVDKYTAFSGQYIHRSLDEVKFDTGLEEKALQKYIFVSLDNFRRIKDNEKKTVVEAAGQNMETVKTTAERMNELEAWMYFLASDKPEDICRLVQEYPEFEELYQEIIWFRYHPEEMMRMVPEAIKMMDEGSFQTMLETRDERLRRQAEILAEKDHEIAEKDSAIAERDNTIAERDNAIAEKDSAIAERDNAIAEKDSAIAERDNAIAEKDNTIAEKDRIIADLQERLAQQSDL